METPVQSVKLDDFRNILIRQEETIIFALIERAQFVRNPEVYLHSSDSNSVAYEGLKGKFGAFDGSFLDFMFSETEKLHALARRYTSPDENAFYPHALPSPILPDSSYPQVLKPNKININDTIMKVYLNKILPDITVDTSDVTSRGSSATADMAVLQALSKRIHFGKFIAEAKFQAETPKYTELIRNNDAEGLMNELTKPAVEEKVLERVKLKASTYGQDVGVSASEKNHKVDPQLISDLYRDFVMPLTKDVQVAYLLQRLSHPAISIANGQGSFDYLAAMNHFGNETLDQEHLSVAGSISKVFTQVTAGQTAYGVVPLEDSESGMVKETQLQLIHHSLKVSAELFLYKTFACASQNAQSCRQSDVAQVFAPEDLNASLQTVIERTWPTARIVPAPGVLEAAQQASYHPNSVAVTTSAAASVYKLNVDESESSRWRDVLDTSSFIRFGIVSKNYPASTGQDKTCLSMEISHQVGSLLNALEIWKKHGVNLSRLESIYREKRRSYDFVVEIDGHVDDTPVQCAMNELEKDVGTVKHLGSFPTAKQ